MYLCSPDWVVPRGPTKQSGTSGRGHSARPRARYFPRPLPSGVPNVFAGPLCIGHYAASGYDSERGSYSRSYLTSCAVPGTAILREYHTGHPAPGGDTGRTALGGDTHWNCPRAYPTHNPGRRYPGPPLVYPCHRTVKRSPFGTQSERHGAR